uniref:Uncharacterized protein n=1 Tax=viral metagenome TaxID=1070528 RepID=A0A6M3J2Q4_9ZZZZ
MTNLESHFRNQKQAQKLHELGEQYLEFKKALESVETTAFYIEFAYYYIPCAIHDPKQDKWIKVGNQDKKPISSQWRFYLPEYDESTEHITEQGHEVELQRIPTYLSDDLFLLIPEGLRYYIKLEMEKAEYDINGTDFKPCILKFRELIKAYFPDWLHINYELLVYCIENGLYGEKEK